jgi:endonuclease/exonuclease/phosphatase family metal-dependent hydrolase
VRGAPRRLLLGALACVVVGLTPRLGATQSADAIDVMSFNIRHGRGDDGAHVWPNRRQIVIDLLRESSAPLIGLQEVLDFQLREIAESLPRYRAIGVGRDDGVAAGEFAPVLVDTSRFTVLAQGTFWFSDTPDVPGSMHWGNRITRICTWVRLHDRHTADTLRLYNVHWDHESQPSRERSAAMLLARMTADGGSTDDVLVTGDFNAGEDNAAFRLLTTDANRSLRDTYRARLPDARIVGTFNAFRGDSTGDKIDAILAGAHWAVDAAQIDRRQVRGLWPSDHFPVTARVRRVRRAR